MSVSERTHTALHVVKGAIQKVLGAKLTSSTMVNEAHGRISVQFHRKPTLNEVEQIKELANKKISENVKVDVYIISREQAEAMWDNLIYDLFPLPDHINELQICHIQDWNVNACNKKHTATTGEIGRILITKTRFRNSKQLLEVSFDIE
jgi:alanyl-tRNA synthetase